MSETFFEDLGIPEPNYFLNAGGGSHSDQTAKIMVDFEKICMAENPDIVVVVGDVNSTLACSIVAKKMKIKVAHIEAGLRSFDLDMPEEINRMVTDAISDYFFTTENDANENLIREGKKKDSIYFVGHVMIDNLQYQYRKIMTMNDSEFILSDLKKKIGEYVFLTLHRPSNVDYEEKLKGIIRAFETIGKTNKVVFPIHPRTKKMLDMFKIKLSDNIIALEPLSFKDSLYLWKDSLCVFTDSGGLQEETTGLGVPCFTIRKNTERPVTVKEGTNTLLGSSGDAIVSAFEKFKSGEKKSGRIPRFWDGNASERIVDVLLKK
jgi:UDP-N-acetylglucosamine 2-epimerase (non-hydrolysing)